MKMKTKAYALAAATLAGVTLMGCNKMDDSVKLTVWVSEGDRAFAQSVIDEYKKANPDKKYRFTIDAQGENEMATRVLKDVENAADVFSFPNDQIAKLVNGDALTRIAGTRLETIKTNCDENAVRSATVKKDGEDQCFGIPYTDNTFFLYYDKSILNETDVQSVEGILAKLGNKKFAFPMTDGWYSTSFYFGKGLDYSVEYDANLAETQIDCNFNNATGVAVTNAMWSLVQDTRVKADANDSKITAGFNDGSIGAAVSGIWNRTSIERSLGENFAATKLPTYTLNKGQAGEEQVQLVSFAGYKLMGVNNYSKQKTEALSFIEFYTNKQNQLKLFSERGYVPTNLEAKKDESLQSDPCANAITKQLAFAKPQINVPSTLWVPMEGLGNAMITAAGGGSFNLTEQLNACVSAIKKTTREQNEMQ